MPVPPEDIAAWQHRIAETFRGPTGIVGERLCSVYSAERAAQQLAAQELQGLITIGDALLDFLFHSLDLLRRPVRVYHLLRTPLFVASTSRLRSSYNLFWLGYYFDATCLLRGVFENVVQLCADAHGWVDIGAWFDTDNTSLDKSQREVSRAMHRNRVQLTKIAEGRLFKTESGLSRDDQDELYNMQQVLHSHVHRTEMHLVHLIDDARTSGHPASHLPAWDAHKASHYGHISMAIGWMLTRLVAYAVPIPRRDMDWVLRRDTLDAALLWYFDKWDKPLGGTATRYLMSKFTFDDDWGEPQANA